MSSPVRSSTQPSGVPADEAGKLIQVGSEMLNQGKLSEARVELELAIAAQPKNQRVQNLLALTCFKMGVLDRAAELYEMLVRENPVEPTLRVNLGLVYLKLGSVPDAVRELQTSVDLAPEHKKAQNYLGLALAQAGEIEAARNAFVAAGSTGMIEKMDRAIAERVAASAPPPRPSTEPAGASLAQKTFVELEGEMDGVTQLAPMLSSRELLAPNPHSPPGAMDGALGGVVPGAFLSDLAQALRLAPAQTVPFHVAQGVVGIRVQGEVLTRMENLVCVTGQVSLQPEMKRFRGRATDKAFGKGERRFVRASGQGIIWASGGKRLLLPLDLGENSAYFAEEMVFGFEEALTFENGRLPGKNVADINLVHLRGRGKVLLSLPGPLRSVEVSASFPATVAADHLVGWLGGLTPKIAAPAGDAEGDQARLAVELAGDGYVFLALPEPR